MTEIPDGQDQAADEIASDIYARWHDRPNRDAYVYSAIREAARSAHRAGYGQGREDAAANVPHDAVWED